MELMMRNADTLERPLLPDLADEELLVLVRAGNIDAFEELYRRHAPAARRAARAMLPGSEDPEDAVADAFTNVLGALRHGRGPHTNFRGYLMTCVRHWCERRGRAAVRSGELHLRQFESQAPAAHCDHFSESGLVASAFGTLAPRWRRVLWMLAVEDRDVAAVADELGVTTQAASAVSHRARCAFAEAYLTEHIVASIRPACAPLAKKLARFVRGSATELTTRRIELHLGHCPSCAATVQELLELNATLR
jgi:RNA polymerase sigma factor (sigma-70 family)